MLIKDISVIIPFYNRVHYLPQAIASVFHQNSGNIELILVDDGSTDGSAEAALEIWNTHSRNFPGRTDRSMQLIKLPHSGMPGLARNRGVDAATHNLIAFLDSDDLWLPHKLELQLPLHENFRISHCREEWLRFSPDEGPPGYKTISQKSQNHRREGDIFEDALWKCIIGPSTVIMDRSLFLELGGFREDIQIAEDYEFWLRVTSRELVGYIDKSSIQKRAGMADQDQLSERFDFIEGFRINALLGFLESAPELNPVRLQYAWQVLRRKAEIFLAGAEKRGKRESMKEMQKIIETSDNFK